MIVLTGAMVLNAIAGPVGRSARVLSSSQQAVQIEFVPAFTSFDFTFKDRRFVHHDFDGSAAFYKPSEAGMPDLRFTILPLAFPAQEGNIVRIIAADYEDIPSVNFRPTPTLTIKEGVLVVEDYAENASIYAENRFLPGPVAELSPVQQSRSMLIGGVRIYPLQYNPATRTLRKYSRIVVEVVYGAATLPRVSSTDHELYDLMIMNAPEARSWQFASMPALNRVSSGAPSVLASGTWYRITVTDEGMYLLDANWFSNNGINLSSIDPRTIKIYGNGGGELSENPLAPRPVDLVENAIHVEGESDGQFNSGDHVLFYGRAVQGVRYDATAKTMRHYIHKYSRVNYYWLTLGGVAGKRMQTQQSITTTPFVTPTKFIDAVWVEPDTVNIAKSGKNWVGLPINPGGTQVRTFTLAGHIPNEPRTYRYNLVGSSVSGATYNVRESGTIIGTHPIWPIAGFALATDGRFEVTGAFPIQNSISQLSFEFVSGSAGATGWLDWVEIIYPRSFDPVNNSLRFRSPDTTAAVEYRLGQFTGAAQIFNVTDYANVRRVNHTSGAFRAAERSGQLSEYLAVGTSALKVPSGVTRIDNQNLRGISQTYDYIIITSQEFRSAANRLKTHRENPAYGGLRTIVVDVEEIYNEFSGGVPDISAIRDFLKYAYENWSLPTPPRFVCFFGQGSYDYKGISGTKSSYVPTWQTAESYDDVASSASDDFFVRIGSGTTPWFISGRINSRSPREAEQFIDKLIVYDTQSAKDPWQLRSIYVGDDGITPENPFEGEEHTRGAEAVASRTPDIFEKVKIYLEEYPAVQTAQGRRKPGAYQDIIDNINRGALIVNFTGHGNPTVWTHEQVFSTQTSIPLLFNRNKFFVFFGATCNFSQFDDLNRTTGSELLMNRTEGGAIGVVSASRKVYSAQNHQLNNGIYDRMFTQDAFGRIRVERVATALYQYKQIWNNDNDEKYFWMGDPAMRLQFPQSYAVMDSINSTPVGTTGSGAVQLKALAKVTVQGSIRTPANALDSTFSGRMTLVVNDATRRINIPSFGSFTYSAPGGLIYRGENSVSNGRFTATFVVPKDIAYADSTTRGRIVAYMTGTGGGEAAGFTSRIWIGGTETNIPIDTVGPVIRIYLGTTYDNSRSFRNGDVVNENPTLFVDLADSNGINTSTSGVGHRIEAWINNSAESRDMTEFYTSKLNNYQEGTVTYPLRNLAQGRNTIRVRAWDTHNNASAAEAYFEVLSSDQLRVVDVMNYPNPFARTTAFTFRHNQALPVNATVKVYTLAGRLIRTLERFAVNESFVSIPWDGRDRDGDEIANGVYLYKILVRTIDGRFSSEVLGKLAVAK